MNELLDRWIRPSFRLLGRPRSAFHVCGLIGLALAVALSAGLGAHRSLSPWVLGGAAVTACVTFLALAMATKIVTGEEKLIYYHHEVAILATVTLMLWLLRQPVLAYLDVTLLGVGTFLFCGRVGCFMVGCCHGRPHHWGVRYRPEHAEAGFTSCFVDVRLFPIQLVESAWVFATVAVGIVLVLRGAVPGEALAWYVVVYDVGRFGFEFARGDTRPYRGGFSEAQWTSMLLMLVVVVAEFGGVIPLQAWHLAATAGMVATMLGVSLYRRSHGDGRHRLLSAGHIRELAEATDLLSARGRPTDPVLADHQWLINVATTRVGIKLSAGRAWEGSHEVRHYTLSSAGASLSHDDARGLARVLLLLRHRGWKAELVPGREGVFHLIVRPGQSQGDPLPRQGMPKDQPHPALVR